MSKRSVSGSGIDLHKAEDISTLRMSRFREGKLNQPRYGFKVLVQDGASMSGTRCGLQPSCYYDNIVKMTC